MTLNEPNPQSELVSMTKPAEKLKTIRGASSSGPPFILPEILQSASQDVLVSGSVAEADHLADLLGALTSHSINLLVDLPLALLSHFGCATVITHLLKLWLQLGQIVF